MIHVSADDNESAASRWAADGAFPWLTVLPRDVRASGLEQFGSGFVPDYVLVSADGEKVAEGPVGVFDRIGEL